LLANVLLDEVDQELERRGHTFVRYADDLRVYVGSRKSGQQVMGSLVRLFGQLRLKVNHAKSAVDRAWNRPFLGFAFWAAKGGRVAVRIAAKSIAKMKVRVRLLTRRTCGRSLVQIAKELRSYLLGWKGYFGLTETPRVLRELDEWIRRLRLEAGSPAAPARPCPARGAFAIRGSRRRTPAAPAADAARRTRSRGRGTPAGSFRSPARRNPSMPSARIVSTTFSP
jgi:hypothetical protein